METYHFGVSGTVIWISHILMGLFFFYIGYKIINKKQIVLNDGIWLVIIGALGLVYHAHLMYNDYFDIDDKQLSSAETRFAKGYN